MKRALIVCEHWGFGGTEVFVADLCRWLNALGGFHVRLCVLGEAHAEIPADIPFHEVLCCSGLAEKASALLKSVRTFAPDTCHLNLYSSAFACALAVRLRTRTRIVTTFHIPLWQWRRIHRLAWRGAARLSHVNTGVSTSVLASFNRRMVRNGYLTSPPLPQLFRGAIVPTLPRRAPGGPLRIIGVGRLALQKDWPTLLRAVSRLVRAELSVSLTIVGQGELDTQLRALRDDLDITSAVDFVGQLDPVATRARLLESDVFVLPSVFEGFGIAAIEAMALGTAVVTADYEASEDYIDDAKTGHRFPRGDDRALADILRWHIDHSAASATMAQAGAEFVQARFAPDVVFEPFRCSY